MKCPPIKKSLAMFTITFLLNVVQPYFLSSGKFLSRLTLSFNFKKQIFSVASESVAKMHVY
jgi:hypothetical protein